MRRLEHLVGIEIVYGVYCFAIYPHLIMEVGGGYPPCAAHGRNSLPPLDPFPRTDETMLEMGVIGSYPITMVDYEQVSIIPQKTVILDHPIGWSIYGGSYSVDDIYPLMEAHAPGERVATEAEA